MYEHLPVLVIALPIVGAALALLVGLVTRGRAWSLTAATLAVEATLGLWLAWGVLTQGGVSYAVGGYAPPAGIELAVDALSAVVLALVVCVALAGIVYARGAGPHSTPFHALYLLFVGGLAGMTVTGDVFNLYVFLEITGLAAYGLVASGQRDGAAVAALKYLIVGTTGASLYLLGVGYLLVATGTLNMADLASTLGTDVALAAVPVLTAFALVLGGLAVKVALFPVHTWQPDAYGNAPDSVVVVLSALASTVAAYAVARVVFDVFTVDFFLAVPVARTVVVVLASLSVLAGAVLAVAQTDVRRMLAYSSVSQFGLILAGVAVATTTAVTGAVLHLVGHAVMKGGLFAAVGIAERRTGARHVTDFDGLGSRAPMAAAALAVLALAMVGVPPAVGFVGKWYLVIGAARAGAWPLVAVLLLSTLLTLAYFARLIERMYFRDAPGADHGAGTGGSDDGNLPADAGADATRAVPDGGDGRVTAGMIAVLVLAVLATLALGAAGPALESALDGTLHTIQP